MTECTCSVVRESPSYVRVKGTKQRPQRLMVSELTYNRMAYIWANDISLTYSRLTYIRATYITAAYIRVAYFPGTYIGADMAVVEFRRYCKLSMVMHKKVHKTQGFMWTGLETIKIVEIHHGLEVVFSLQQLSPFHLYYRVLQNNLFLNILLYCYRIEPEYDNNHWWSKV